MYEKNQYLLPGAVLIAGLFIGLGLYLGLRDTSKSTDQQQAGAQKAEQLNTTPALIKATLKPVESAYVDKSLEGSYPIVIGHADAPVTVHYWFDYQCPFCKAVDVGHPQIPNVKPSMALIVEKYVDTGKVKLEFDSFPFLGNDSITASEYAHAIWMLYPDKFYEWHTDMMHAQDAEGDQGFGNAQTIDMLIALIPGIDDAKIKQYIVDNKDAIDTQVSKEQKNGAKNGVTGTPGFLIGDKQLEGAQSPETIMSAIDDQLN